MLSQSIPYSPAVFRMTLPSLHCSETLGKEGLSESDEFQGVPEAILSCSCLNRASMQDRCFTSS